MKQYFEPIDNPDKFIINDNVELSIIQPDESINLLYNPECVTLDGYTFTPAIGSFGTMSLSNDEQYVGLNSIHANMYYNDILEVEIQNDLVANQPYTFSVAVKNKAKLRIHFANSSNIRISNEATFITNNFWSRIEHTFVPLQSYSNVKILIFCESVGVKLYFDAFQLEPKSYATTFISGNVTGYNELEQVNPYFWVGSPHNSPSVRLKSTRSGGKKVSLKDIGFDIYGFEGLGMPQFKHSAQDVALSNASYYQGTTIENRKFSLFLALNSNSQNDYFKSRSLLSNLIMPREKQLLRMFIAINENGQQASQEYFMDCIYNKGLEGQYNNLISERLSLEFAMFDPFIKSVAETSYELNTYKNLEFAFSSSTFDNPIYTNGNVTKTWNEIAKSNANYRFLIVNKILKAQDSNIYIFGNLYDVSTGFNYLCGVWNGKTITPLLQVDVGAMAYDAVIAQNDSIYVVGDFDQIDGVSALYYFQGLNIVRYQISSNITSYVFETDGMIRSIDIKGSKLAIAGTFGYVGTATGQHTAISVATYDIFTQTVTQLGNGLTLSPGQYLTSIKYGKDSKVWVGGNFSYTGTDQNIVYFDTGTNQLGLIDSVTYSTQTNVTPSNCNSAGQTVVNTIEITDNNDVYIGGVFTSTGTCENENLISGSLDRPMSIAKWNGLTWEPLDILTRTVTPVSEVGVVRSIKYNPLNGYLYVGGDFVYAGKRYIGDYNQYYSPLQYNFDKNASGLAIWTGAAWLPYPFRLFKSTDRSNTNIRGIISTIEFIGQQHSPIKAGLSYNGYSVPIETSNYGLLATFPDSIIFGTALNEIIDESATNVSAFFSEVTEINTKCSELSKPILTFSGQGVLQWLHNSNGRYIHLHAKQLFNSEIVTIELDKLVPTITSSLEGDIRSIVNTTSSLSGFVLDKGDNIIETFILPDINKSVYGYLTFRTQLLSIDSLYNICE